MIGRRDGVQPYRGVIPPSELTSQAAALAAWRRGVDAAIELGTTTNLTDWRPYRQALDTSATESILDSARRVRAERDIAREQVRELRKEVAEMAEKANAALAEAIEDAYRKAQRTDSAPSPLTRSYLQDQAVVGLLFFLDWWERNPDDRAWFAETHSHLMARLRRSVAR